MKIEVVRLGRFALQFGHDSSPWMTDKMDGVIAKMENASIRPRLIAVDDVERLKSAVWHVETASIRPRLIAVDDISTGIFAISPYRASIRPRLIAVDDDVARGELLRL